MKFENIKVGDEVFVRKSISYGWYKSERFFVSAKVERTTKTQFIADGRRFKKDSGREIGDSFGQEVFLPGEKVGWHSDVIVSDQSKEMTKFKQKVDQWYEIKRMADNLSVSIDCKNLSSIHGLLKQIEKLNESEEI